jgi:hypothetical protein
MERGVKIQSINGDIRNRTLYDIGSDEETERL